MWKGICVCMYVHKYKYYTHNTGIVLTAVLIVSSYSSSQFSLLI